MSEVKPNLLGAAKHQLAIALRNLGLDSSIYEILKHPKRSLIVSLPRARLLPDI